MMEFQCSRKTEYYKGDKKVSRKDVPAGSKVDVEGRHGVDGISLTATLVRLVTASRE